MKKAVILAVLLCCLAWVFPARAQGVLPANPDGWASAGNSNVIGPPQLQNFAGDQADVLREYGVLAAEQRQYAKGSQTIALTLYKMVDPSAAYGAFTFSRDPAMRRMDLGDSISYAAAGTGRALFVVGNYFGVASYTGQVPAEALFNEIGAALLPHADARPYPIIAGYLPRSSVTAGNERYPLRRGGAVVTLPARLNLVPGSERYVLGPRALAGSLPSAPSETEDWLGFRRSAESVAARYRPAGNSSGQELTLVITEYPTQQIAASQFATLGNWMALNAEPDQANGKMIVYGTRSSALVALVFGAQSREQANSLLDHIQYHSSVTWNEPSFQLREPPFATMMIGVFEGTGVIMVLALAVGLGFGGFRLIVKLLLPGRVFDRNSQVEILQLGLNSKPIDSRDFY